MAIMTSIMAITAISHALAGVSYGLMALMIKVDQSRVPNDLLAVMALYRVTPGAWQRVPISGANQARIAGQGTSLVHVSTGAAKSEPHEGSGRGAPAGCAVPGLAEHGWWCRCTRGAKGTRGAPKDAQNPGVDGCIYGAILTLRLGQGGARQCPRTVPEPVPGTVPYDTRHPSPGIRHPASVTRTPATHHTQCTQGT